MRLIEDWRKAWRFWSLRLGAAGTAMTSILIAFPEAAIQTWAMMPPVMQEAIPDRWMPMVGVVVLVLGMVARLVQQDSLHEPPEGDP